MLFHPTAPATTLLLWGMVIHLFCDWLLQNDWMATHKSNVHHPAAYVHSGIHFLGLLLIFSPLVALMIAIIHLLIDTRKPLQWWRGTFRQTQEGPVALHVALWGDQVAHIIVLAIVAFLVAR
jgi:Protein of unknown function (DUF3307)